MIQKVVITIARELEIPFREPIEAYAYINGRKISGERKVPVKNPANPEEIVGYYPECTQEEATLAIESAVRAFHDWSRLSAHKRAEILLRISEKIQEHVPDFVEVFARESGKVRWSAEGEMRALAYKLHYVASLADEVEKVERIDDENGKLLISRKPYGVVSAITPWNAPILLAVGDKIAPALLAGNVVVLKPSPFAPLIVSKIVELIGEELPPGVLNLIHRLATV